VTRRWGTPTLIVAAVLTLLGASTGIEALTAATATNTSARVAISPKAPLSQAKSSNRSLSKQPRLWRPRPNYIYVIPAQRHLTRIPSTPIAETQTWPRTMTSQQVLGLVSIYRDWNPATMVRLAFCESSYQPSAWNSTPVWENGIALHSAGLLGVLGGSFNPVVNVQQAHNLYVSKMNNGQERHYQPWTEDFLDGCVYG
jgi:hypothetical protein